jgi:universal stress protein A
MKNRQRKEKGVMTPKKILLCTDFSENSKPAVRLAADYAASFGAKLVLFHVNDLNARPLPWFDDLVSPEDTLKNVEFACNRELKRLCEEIGKTLPSVTSCSAEGVPSTKIADFAKREGADLIVMGTHGWRGLNRLLKRSTADDVVRSAPCPVLVVRS